MNKRGQFYLIIVIILAVVAYGVSSEINSVEEPILFEDFSDVSENYIREGANVINYAIYNNVSVNETLSSFSKEFLTYAKQRNPTVSLLYMYSNGTNITIKNFFSQTAVINNRTTFGSEEVLVEDIAVEVGGKEFIHQVPIKIEDFGEGWYSLVTPTDKLNLSVGGIIHNFDFRRSDVSEFKVILKAKGQRREVVMGGNASTPFDIIFSPEAEVLNREVVHVYEEK
jgi:hypothetical protein